MAQRTKQQRREDLDKAMDVWRAKEAYDAQLYFPLVLLGLFFGLMLLAAMLGGCADISHKYQRSVWGIDCRQEKLVNGQCVAAR